MKKPYNMKHPCFQKQNRACELSEAKYNYNKIKNLGVQTYLINQILI